MGLDESRALPNSSAACRWRLLTGLRPWAGLSPAEVRAAVEAGQGLSLPAPLRDQRGLPALCLRCMSHEPADRPSAQQAMDELEAILEQVGT